MRTEGNEFWVKRLKLQEEYIDDVLYRASKGGFSSFHRVVEVFQSATTVKLYILKKIKETELLV